MTRAKEAASPEATSMGEVDGYLLAAALCSDTDFARARAGTHSSFTNRCAARNATLGQDKTRRLAILTASLAGPVFTYRGTPSATLDLALAAALRAIAGRTSSALECERLRSMGWIR